MKTIGIILLALLLAHLVAVGIGVAWLGATDRLSKERLYQVKAIFVPTIKEEKARLEEEEKSTLAQKAVLDEKARMEEVADGPTTVNDRLEQDQTKRDLVLAKIQRLQREMNDMNRNLEFAKLQLSHDKKQLTEEREAFKKFKEDMENQRMDADFERVVNTYSKLKPKLAKQAFIDLIKQGSNDMVVEYLAAMPLRKSASILNQFKDDAEIPIAANLLEQLRQRGITPPANLGDDATPLASK